MMQLKEKEPMLKLNKTSQLSDNLLQALLASGSTNSKPTNLNSPATTGNLTSK